MTQLNFALPSDTRVCIFPALRVMSLLPVDKTPVVTFNSRRFVLLSYF
jgi:hypothetical protein